MSDRNNRNSCIHCLYAIFLLALTVCGVCLLVLGCWLKITLNELSNISSYLSFTVPISIISLGVIITLVGLIGFTCTGHPSCLLLYGYCLLFFFALLLFAFLTVYYYCPDVNDSLFNELHAFMTTYKPHIKCCNMMDDIQTKFDCCGIDDASDWLQTPNAQIPQSCCTHIPCNTNDRTQIFEEGCRINIRYLISDKKLFLQALLFPAALVSFLGTAITFYYGTILTHQLYEEI